MFSSNSFKDKNTLEERREMFRRRSQQHPDKILVVCERQNRFFIVQQLFGKRQQINDQNQTLYLVVPNRSLGSIIIQTIKQRLVIPQDESIFIYGGKNQIITNTTHINEFYEENQDQDGFLYLKYTDIPSFG